MAKKALVNKANKKPKFKVRGYTRCNRCGRPARGVPQVRAVPHLPARDGACRRTARRAEVQLVTAQTDLQTNSEKVRGRPRMIAEGTAARKVNRLS